MKKGLLLMVAIIFINLVFGQGKYHKARIYYNSTKDIMLLANQGVAIDHGKHKKGIFIESDFSDNELIIAKALGLKTEILINDVQAFYVNRNKSATVKSNKNASCGGGTHISYPVPTNYNNGSMGGFLTYGEMLQELDDMATLYPNIITVKQSISNYTTVEGRPIYWVKISDNPTSNETEPEMLYTAIHHAREPGSLQQTIFYMWYLLENYNSNSEVQAIVNNTEMYFVPCINPDGYVYNETTNASGGGMWRKNRRDNLDGNFGVDLNRNYSYQWGGAGTSAATGSDVYRGTNGFSEVETQAMKWFCEQHDFKMALNSHTYSQLLLFPFGYATNQISPDHATFEAISSLMVAQNGYANQISAALYAAAGDSDDWMYAETSTHDKIMAMTPEVGASFWPWQGDIINMCNDMVFHNLMAANIITNFATIEDKEALSISTITGHFNYEIKRLGFDNSGNFTVRINPISSNITSLGGVNSHNGMALLQADLDSITYVLNSNITDGESIIYELITNNGLYDRRDTITKTYGSFQPIFSDNGTDLNNWNSNNWGTTNTYSYSPSTSITDSPNGDYSNNETTTIQLSNGVSLVNAVSANVSFYARWNIENNYDYVLFQISIDGGNTWVSQCGKYTNPGVSDQIENEPLYDGLQNGWVNEEIDLSNYIGQTIKTRFKLVSDMGVTEDGFYFDDFSVNVIQSSNGIKENYENGMFVGQNMPNPSNDLTTVYYQLENKTNNHQFVILNQVGKIIKKQNLHSEKGKVVIDTKEFSAGVYYYYISGNGVTSSIQKMMVIK